MEYRGVRYAIRIGIARLQWQEAVYLPDKELPKETTVVGTRQNAEIAASSIIDAWLKKRSGGRDSGCPWSRAYVHARAREIIEEFPLGSTIDCALCPEKNCWRATIPGDDLARPASLGACVEQRDGTVHFGQR